MQEAIRKVVGAAPVDTGKVKLELPPLIENGNAVPLAVSVDSPMTDGRSREGDPRVHREEPAAQRGELLPRAARRAARSVATRVRLADSQTVVAIARAERRLVLVRQRGRGRHARGLPRGG